MVTATRWTICVVVALLVSSALTAPSSRSQLAVCSGGRCTNGTLCALVTLGPSATSPMSSPVGMMHVSGLLGSSPACPDVDSDGDGQPDEWDGDNDNDGLTDWVELTGTYPRGLTLTDPNCADSDGDGMGDGAEVLAHFDPTNAADCLRIIGIECVPKGLVLSWFGRGGGMTNAVSAADAVSGGAFTNRVLARPFYGGEYPWFAVTNVHVERVTERKAWFYRVEVLQGRGDGR